MDFFKIDEQRDKQGVINLKPLFVFGKIDDFMIKGRSFYAIFNQETNLWSTNESSVPILVDDGMWKRYEELTAQGEMVRVHSMRTTAYRSWVEYRSYIYNMWDTFTPLDSKVTFQDQFVRKEDYVSKRLPYSLSKEDCPAFKEIMETLYDQEERLKLIWAIGSILAGDSINIEKFIVLYGEPGSGKSTFLNIVQQLFEGYWIAFEASKLTNRSDFGLELFKTNPLVAIDHEGELSRIEDNSRLNSLVSHDTMPINEKNKPKYNMRFNAFLFIGTNTPVKITNSKSGLIRRLIDTKPSGRRLNIADYDRLTKQIKFELGAIANYCLGVYEQMGINFYNHYVPMDMVYQTDPFFNFVEENYYVFKEGEGTTLKQAYEMYKNYCSDSGMEYRLPKHKVREELKQYFNEFNIVTRVEGKQVRNYYKDFLVGKFEQKHIEDALLHPNLLALTSQESRIERLLRNCPAQYTTQNGVPKQKWHNVRTTLKDLDTKKLHYVRPPLNHIVIDFDLKNEDGEKDAKLNLEAASKWPATYAEFSKSGKGVHLHYYYKGDVEQLSRIFSDGIEIKVFTGNASLRRQFTFCNNEEVATLSGGLPMKGAKMINYGAVKSEKELRAKIEKALRKEIHSATKPNVDFIHKLLEDAYGEGLKYDVADMRQRVLTFATQSTNQAAYCIALVANMQFKSDEPSNESIDADGPIVFYDVEVFPNLFIVCWKPMGGEVTAMINPTAAEVESLFDYKLVGFNNRRYDNHILYARYIGYTEERLYQLSQKIIGKSANAMFGEAYNLSYADIYDFSTKKQSLKKFEIELGLFHLELGIPWDQPVPEEMWDEVAAYCKNDVEATEATFHSRKEDFVARQIMAKLSGLTVNDTTQQHAGRIMFGDEQNPQSQFVYTDLSEMFPGYTFEQGKSWYRDEDPKEGGYVYAEPGIYHNVALCDVASMHPTSILALNLFGPYTARFRELVEARINIKHQNFDAVRNSFGGALSEFLVDEAQAEDLSHALKIFINSIYGFTSATFANKFKDPRNIDNIVAKRGALFMIDLKHAMQEQGYTVAHIKTDSIKIPCGEGDNLEEVVQFIYEFGLKYGYTFEHEAIMDSFCLLNDAVYICRYAWHQKAKKIGQWDATGTQLIHPYVFKTLFSGETIEFKDLCETKSVTTAMYLDMGGEPYQFVGKVGQFCPMKTGGGILYREKDGKYNAVGGTKGYEWLESVKVQQLQLQDDINMEYFERLANQAREDISKFGDFEEFVALPT